MRSVRMKLLAAVGALAPMLSGGCPSTPSEGQHPVWCASLDVHEQFFVPSSGPVEQDFPQEQRCMALVECGGTERALMIDPEGQCTLLVDFATPDQGVVRTGTRCESTHSRIGGASREIGYTTGGTVTLRNGVLEASVDWDVEIRTSDVTRLGAVQKYAIRNGFTSPELRKLDPEGACREPEPRPGPEDFSEVVGCTPQDFVDASADSAERVVRFGNELGNRYSPRCLSIAAGQTVSFQGPFQTYGLMPGVPASISTGAPFTPITYVFFSDRKDFTFPLAGDFIYSNGLYAAVGMTGMIRVR
ncbi:hypothetical protein [Hyalangium minutum]|uniref:Lipoprotein n=1 Tax=Hyalangium minutum TaxID=394096 RepID=A0A085WNE2_9BACT|nr:hypothetical protein [Hyalangium minutum]KFE69205.1 hypothetical protein DB31_7107 [Hyalangium minutum]